MARAAPYAPKPAGPTFTPRSTPQSPSWRRGYDETTTATGNTTTDTSKRPSRRRRPDVRRRFHPRPARRACGPAPHHRAREAGKPAISVDVSAVAYFRVVTEVWTDPGALRNVGVARI